MSYFSYGQTIQNARRRCGMTQEQLADGICSVSSLSKIENDRQVPHYRTFEALMQRLGEQYDQFVCYVNKQDFERQKLLKKIKQNLWNEDFHTLKVNFGKYKEITGPEHRLEYQWKCVIEQMILLLEGGEVHAIREQILHIISMTQADFPEKWKSKEIYTHCELFSILMLGFCEQKMGKYENALDIYQMLLQYAQKTVCDSWVDEIQTAIYYLLSWLRLQMGDNRDSARYCREGIKKCLKREKYHMAIRLLSLWPHIMAEPGKHNEPKLADLYIVF